MQFIEAVEKRDHRKTKHVGFFVNAGSVERVGEKPVKMRRKRKPADIDATGGLAGPAPHTSSSSAALAPAPAAVDGPVQQRAPKAPRLGSAPGAAPPQVASSVAQMAMAAAREAAARPGDSTPLHMAPGTGVASVNAALQQVRTRVAVLLALARPRLTVLVTLHIFGIAALS